MALAKKIETSLERALDQLQREGGHVPVIRGGETVAVLVSPEELERLEDERDLAILRAAKAEQANEPRVGLEEIAAELGVELPD